MVDSGGIDLNKLYLNTDCIQAQTRKALLFHIPGSEMYFWHPRKFTRFVGKDRSRVIVFYNDNWVFNVFTVEESGKEKINGEKIAFAQREFFKKFFQKKKG